MRSASGAGLWGAPRARSRPSRLRSAQQDPGPTGSVPLQPPVSPFRDPMFRAARFLSGRLQFPLARDDLGGELEVRLTARAFEIVEEHRLTVGRRLGDTD